jgi:dTDP-4-amino-4,6-dideoxygalactose transaminase
MSVLSPTLQAVRKTVPVARPYLGKEEEDAAVAVLRSGWVSQGPKVAEFERAFADYVGAQHAVAVSSCTTALHLALLAVGIRTGDEVICPSFSFVATANCIVYTGGTPVFVDIDPDTYNLDPHRIEEAITPRTRAILAVHQVGLPASLDEILKVAGRHGLPVVEDAACAVGAQYFGQRIGAPRGLLACFSFHPRKILTTGEGGMITTADAELAARLRCLRQHAMSVSDAARHNAQQIVFETYNEVGYNYRMTDLQAAVGLVQLSRLDDLLARRRYLASRYSERLRSFGWLEPPMEPEGLRHNFQSYLVRLKPQAPIARDALMQGLLDRGVSTRRGIMAIHREAPFQHDRWDAELQATNAATDHTVILPLFHQMTEDEQDYVIESIRDIGDGGSGGVVDADGESARMVRQSKLP